METNLKKIINDRTSGSTDILLQLIKWSKRNIWDSKKLTAMFSAAEELKTFSNIQLFIKKFKKVLVDNDKSLVNNFLNESLKRIENESEELFKNVLPYLNNSKNLVTLSNSRTVAEILLKLNKHHRIKVAIGESRPQLEGRILAKELLNNKVKVEVIPDVMLANAVEKTDSVIIGADTILSNGDIVNKTGSRGLAIIASYFKKPFYVLASSNKISRSRNYLPEKRDENEIWNFKHPLLTRSNFYFEVVEKKLITKIIMR